MFTIALLALAASAAAAPVSCAPPTDDLPRMCITIATNPVTGAYIDQGCGTVVHPSPGLCVRTQHTTTEASAVYATTDCFAGSPGGWGGRWDVALGETRIRNMEAQTADYCMAASDGTVTMDKCDTPADPTKTNGAVTSPDASANPQIWISAVSKNADDKYTFTVKDTNLCMTLPANTAEPLALTPCDGSAAQDFLVNDLA